MQGALHECMYMFYYICLYLYLYVCITSKKCSREIIIKMSLQDQKAINSTNYWRPNMWWKPKSFSIYAVVFSVSFSQYFSITIHSVLFLAPFYRFGSVCAAHKLYECICMRSLCCVLFWFRFPLPFLWFVFITNICIRTHAHTHSNKNSVPRTMVCSILSTDRSTLATQWDIENIEMCNVCGGKMESVHGLTDTQNIT